MAHSLACCCAQHHVEALNFAAARQAVGKVASAGIVGLMVQRLSPRMCFLVVAALPFLVALSSFVMREERQPCCGGRRRASYTP